MTSGGQCVMTCGTKLMLQWSASNWDMLTQEASSSLFKLLKKQIIMIAHHSVCHRWEAIQECSFQCWQWTNLPG